MERRYAISTRDEDFRQCNEISLGPLAKGGGCVPYVGAPLFASDGVTIPLSLAQTETSQLTPSHNREKSLGRTLLVLGLIAVLKAASYGDIPSAAELPQGATSTAGDTPHMSMARPEEQRLVETLLDTDVYRDLPPKYRVWLAAQATQDLKQIPPKHRPRLIERTRILIETSRYDVPRAMCHYLAFAAAAEVAAETGEFDVRVNPRGKIKLKVWVRLSDLDWGHLENRLGGLLGVEALPDPLVVAFGRRKKGGDLSCTPGSPHADELGIDFPEY